MTDREKLIAMIENAKRAMKSENLSCNIARNGFVADFLLANGVTFATDNHVGGKWIPVTERLPEEHDSIFARLHGTKSWLPGMFRTVSDTVLASIEREDGTRTVKAMHTQGGEWNLDSMPWAKKVTHWMPLPEPPKEEV